MECALSPSTAEGDVPEIPGILRAADAEQVMGGDIAAVSAADAQPCPAASCQPSGALSLYAISGASAAPLIGAGNLVQLDIRRVRLSGGTFMQAPASLDIARAITAL